MQFEQPKKMPQPEEGKSLLPPGVQAIIFDIDVVKLLEDDYRREIPAPLPPIRRYQMILTAIPEEPESEQNQENSNITDKSEQNLAISKENDKISPNKQNS